MPLVAPFIVLFVLGCSHRMTRPRFWVPCFVSLGTHGFPKRRPWVQAQCPHCEQILLQSPPRGGPYLLQYPLTATSPPGGLYCDSLRCPPGVGPTGRSPRVGPYCNVPRGGPYCNIPRGRPYCTIPPGVALTALSPGARPYCNTPRGGHIAPDCAWWLLHPAAVPLGAPCRATDIPPGCRTPQARSPPACTPRRCPSGAGSSRNSLLVPPPRPATALMAPAPRGGAPWGPL